MGMINLLQRDKKKRALFLRKECSRKVLKYLFYNAHLPLNIRWAASLRLNSFYNQSSFIKIQSRCSKTFRANSVLRSFRVSRIFFRDYIRFGQVIGVIKKSW